MSINTRTHLHNLKTHFEIDLMDETHGAHKLLSHIIFAKFSAELRQAFKWEIGEEYPTFQQILDSYCKVTTQLENRKGIPKAVNNSQQNSNKLPHSNRRKSRYKFDSSAIQSKIICDIRKK